MPRPVTVLAAVGALVVCAWFALAIRQSSALTGAEALVGTTPQHVGPARAARASGLLVEAAELNPDRTVDLERALLDLDLGRTTASRALAEAVTRAEPQNLTAWVAVARTATHDPPLFKAAARRVYQLEPRQP